MHFCQHMAYETFHQEFAWIQLRGRNKHFPSLTNKNYVKSLLFALFLPTQINPRKIVLHEICIFLKKAWEDFLVRKQFGIHK